MKYRSEMASIQDAILDVREALEDLAITTSRELLIPWDGIDKRWERVCSGLRRSLEAAEKNDRELRQYLYKKAIDGLGPAKAKAESASQDAPATLPPKIQKAIDFIKERSRAKGVVIAKHINVSPERFRSYYVPKLKELGVRNDRQGDGYYLPTA